MQEKYKRLTDSQWQVMAEFLPVKRKRQLNLRDIVDAILWLDRTGTQWRNLPESFPNWKAVNYYFNKWRWDSTLIKMNIGLNMLRRIKEGRDPDPSLVCLDSQSVKAAPMINQERGYDGNKKINGRKRQTFGGYDRLNLGSIGTCRKWRRHSIWWGANYRGQRHSKKSSQGISRPRVRRTIYENLSGLFGC